MPAPATRTPSGCPVSGPPERLEATAPPLGLAAAGTIQRRQVPWTVGNDLLVLWTDGLVDAENDAGEPFGEARLLDEVVRPPEGNARGHRQAVLDEADDVRRPSDR